LLTRKGYIESKNEQDADYIIINSCGFIEDALLETIEETIIISKLKKRSSKIILTGCAVNLYKDQFIKDLFEADYIFNYQDFYQFFEINSYENSIYRRLFDRKWEYLLISEGCSKNCTYCTIPLIKGKYRSFDMNQIIEETKILKERRVEEIILISQDTAYYGLDHNINRKEHPLEKLIEKIYELGIEKIRILYFNLDSLEKGKEVELLEKIYSSKGVIPYFEIPFQHLVDGILKKMGRNINFETIDLILKSIKEKFNDSVIRTSIITGFPGETEKDYLLLKERLLKLPIDYLNVFAYCDMQKAPSYKLKNKVKSEIAVERRNDLINSFEETCKNRLKRFIGTEDEIYIEGEDENYYMGRIWSQTPDLDGLTYIYKDDKSKKIIELNKNNKVKVRILDTFFYDFYGEIL